MIQEGDITFQCHDSRMNLFCLLEVGMEINRLIGKKEQPKRGISIGTLPFASHCSEDVSSF